MNRLGLERGEHIDSKLVTNAVEKAQKKVESMHYESRKHLLEYDDIANAQRKIIYGFRNDLLNLDFDISAKIDENRFVYIENILADAGIFDGLEREDFNLEKVTELFLEDVGLGVPEHELAGLEYAELKQKAYDALTRYYEAKLAVLEDTQRREIERILYLQTLDEAWREHLYQMDILKTGIGLRGYNQKDPLVEYKKESYKLFTELVETVKINAVRVLHSFKINSETTAEDIEYADEAIDIVPTAQKREDRLKNYDKKKS